MSGSGCVLRSLRWGLACGLAVLICSLHSGCGGGAGPPEPDAKLHLQKLLQLYKFYVEQNRQGPPSAEALKEFGKKLSPKERDEQMIGEDLEVIFISPRDKQPYVIKYNMALSPGGETKAVAWEATGQNGKRFVALTMGYVEEYSDEDFQQYK